MSANGQLKDYELVTVQPDVELAPRCAIAFVAMRAAALVDGVVLGIVYLGGYRTVAEQRTVWLAGSASGIAVSYPGTSGHGLGTRLDIAGFSGTRRAWLLKHAASFGFYREFGENDPNHFAYDGVTLPAASKPTTPIAAALVVAQKAGRHMKCMVIGNLTTGQVAFLIAGSEGYIFESAAAYNDFRVVLTAYSAMATTPSEWKWPELPQLDKSQLLFVSDARWLVTVKALAVG